MPKKQSSALKENFDARREPPPMYSFSVLIDGSPGFESWHDTSPSNPQVVNLKARAMEWVLNAEANIFFLKQATLPRLGNPFQIRMRVGFLSETEKGLAWVEGDKPGEQREELLYWFRQRKGCSKIVPALDHLSTSSTTSHFIFILSNLNEESAEGQKESIQKFLDQNPQKTLDILLLPSCFDYKKNNDFLDHFRELQEENAGRFSVQGIGREDLKPGSRDKNPVHTLVVKRVGEGGKSPGPAKAAALRA